MLYTVGKDDNTVDKGNGDFRGLHLYAVVIVYTYLYLLLFDQFSVGCSQLECIFIYNISQGIVQVYNIHVIDHVNVHIDLYNNIKSLLGTCMSNIEYSLLLMF